MPNVQNRGHDRAGAHTADQINKIQRPAKARDDLKGAFAGDENNGSSQRQDLNHIHSTNLKSRSTKQSKGKTPKM